MGMPQMCYTRIGPKRMKVAAMRQRRTMEKCAAVRRYVVWFASCSVRRAGGGPSRKWHAWGLESSLCGLAGLYTTAMWVALTNAIHFGANGIQGGLDKGMGPVGEVPSLV